MVAELNEQPGRDDDARDIRRDETRVMHDLEDRRLVIFLKTGLVERLAAVTQRMIHINQNVAVHSALRVLERDLAREVLWDFGAGILFVGELLQGYAVRFVICLLYTSPS